jgi:DNA-binding GntR family transcriptional regulator
MTTSARFVLGAPTKADAAYLELRARILNSQLEAGSRIDQVTLAEALGVSTTPLREALRRLESEGLVVRSAHRDVTIAPLSLVEARSLFQVRTELEALAIRLAAASMEPEEIELAEQLLMSKGTATAEQYLRDRGILHQSNFAVARAFHHMVFSGSHDAVLIEMLESLWSKTERYAFMVQGPRPERYGQNHTDHLEMLKAIRVGDAEAGELLMRNHPPATRSALIDESNDASAQPR